LQGKKILKQFTGIDIDFKSKNKEFGKKNTAKKSQMRTLIEVFTVPLIVLVSLLSLLVSFLILGILRCCCPSKKPDQKAKNPKTPN